MVLVKEWEQLVSEVGVGVRGSKANEKVEDVVGLLAIAPTWMHSVGTKNAMIDGCITVKHHNCAHLTKVIRTTYQERVCTTESSRQSHSPPWHVGDYDKYSSQSHICRHLHTKGFLNRTPWN